MKSLPLIAILTVTLLLLSPSHSQSPLPPPPYPLASQVTVITFEATSRLSLERMLNAWLHDPAQRSVWVFSVRIDLEYAYYSIIGSQGAEPRWYGTVVYLRP